MIPGADEFVRERERMIEEQLLSRDIHDVRAAEQFRQPHSSQDFQTPSKKAFTFQICLLYTEPHSILSQGGDYV